MVGLILGTGSNGANLSMVTADASDIAKGKVIVGSNGQPITGTLDAYDVTEITPKSTAQVINGPIIIPSSLTVKAVQTQEKTAYPSRYNQSIVPDNNKYLSSVNIKGIAHAGKNALSPTNSTTLEIPLPSVISKLWSIILYYNGDTYMSTTQYRVVSGWIVDFVNGVIVGSTLNGIRARYASSYPWLTFGGSVLKGFVIVDTLVTDSGDSNKVVLKITQPTSNNNFYFYDTYGCSLYYSE